MRGYIVFQVSSSEHWAVKKNFERLEETTNEQLASCKFDTPNSLSLLHGDNVRGWGQWRQSYRIELQIRRQLFPPLLQRRFLSDQALYNLGLSILHEWIIHMNQNLIENDGQATHAQET